MTMKAEIKVIEYGNNFREDIRAGGKTIQLTLDTGERVYRWEQFSNYEEVSRSSWEHLYNRAVTTGKRIIGQMVVDAAFGSDPHFVRK